MHGGRAPHRPPTEENHVEPALCFNVKDSGLVVPVI
jgi:hypothetical protein